MPARRKVELSADETLSDTFGRRKEPLPNVTAPHLFVALECDRPSAGVARHSLGNIDRVTVGRGSERSSKRLFDAGARTLAIALPDRRMSSHHACLVREGVHFAISDLDSRNGTRINGHRIAASTPLGDGDLIQIGHTILRYRAELSAPLEEPADLDSSMDDPECLLGTVDPSLARRIAELGRVARSATSLLVLGETGTGKEVLARAIHRLSGRTGPFVAINCGALPATLLETQLFGHMRGAFSGAVENARGFIRAAERGTLLLDEVGDLPLAAQPALLRVLQEQEVVPVGGTVPIKVDLRVIAATHRPLEALVAAGEFRSDLFARLAGFAFSLPPLRERSDDIGLLIATLVGNRPMRFTPAAGRALLRHRWPLNARELVQLLRVSVSLAGEDAIDLRHLPSAVAACASANRREVCTSPEVDPIRERLIHALRSHEGNVSKVSRDLGKARMQVQRWIKRFGIDPHSFRRP